MAINESARQGDFLLSIWHSIVPVRASIEMARRRSAEDEYAGRS